MFALLTCPNRLKYTLLKVYYTSLRPRKTQKRAELDQNIWHLLLSR